jgi:hypothetical protein
MKYIITIVVIFQITCAALAQSSGDSSRIKQQKPLRAPDENNKYRPVYPIGEAGYICYKTNYNSREKIVFEANPIVRFSFYNNISRNLINGERQASAFYIAFKPQLRMYDDNSLPVKMPSYRAQLGLQKIWRGNDSNLWGLGLESGHYSNGQSQSAFSELYDDDSPQSKAIYQTITDQSDLSAMLNRKNGNFSTNITEFNGIYKYFTKDDFDVPEQEHTVKAGIMLYHDRFWGLFGFGGYSNEDIVLYGKWRLSLGYEYMHKLRSGYRYSIALNSEYIATPILR